VDNEKADKIIKRELEQKLDKFKPAEGVQFVEYDIYGFPKTEEMAWLKRELGLDKAEAEVEGVFIENPEWKFWWGINEDFDIKEEDMDEETKELNKLFEEDADAEEEEEEEEIDENFILKLNEGQKMIEEKKEEDKAKKEPEEDFGFIPAGLSEETWQILINARRVLKERKQNKVELNQQIEDALDDLNDDMEDEDIEIDEIDKDDF